jgi:hypothetical protein
MLASLGWLPCSPVTERWRAIDLANRNVSVLKLQRQEFASIQGSRFRRVQVLSPLTRWSLSHGYSLLVTT